MVSPTEHTPSTDFEFSIWSPGLVRMCLAGTVVGKFVSTPVACSYGQTASEGIFQEMQSQT